MQIGIIANPESGKDVRRLTSGASISSTHEKVAILRRFLTGFRAFSDAEIHFFDDLDRITRSSLTSLKLEGVRIDVETVGTSEDTVRAARVLQGVKLVVSLGGDGTNRAIAKGWRDVPILPLSTGTNNAFATTTEPTVAGIAAAFIVNGILPANSISLESKVIHANIEGESNSDIALVDLVGTLDRFVGSRSIVDPAQYQFGFLTQSNASKVGMVGVAGTQQQVGPKEDKGISLMFNESSGCVSTVRAAVAPGLVKEVRISVSKLVPLDEPVVYFGPAVLAFDGERERYLRPNQRVTSTVRRDGPRLFNVEATLNEVVRLGLVEQDFVKEVAHA